MTAPTPNGPGGPSRRPAAPSPNPVALLVEASPVIRLRYSGVLADLGCRVLQAVDGVDALVQARERGSELALVVLDLQLGRTDGRGVLSQLRRLSSLKTTPIVVLTPPVDRETVRSILDHGATDVIQRDMALSQAGERLAGHLGQAAPLPVAVAEPSAAEFAARAREFVTGRRSADSSAAGPWVLFGDGRAEVADMVTGRAPAATELYAAAGAAVVRCRRIFAGLDFGYGFEHDAEAIWNAASSQVAPPGLVVVSDRHPDAGTLLARLVAETNLPVYVLVDATAEGPARAPGGVRTRCLDRARLHVDAWQRLLLRHLFPPTQALVTGLRLAVLDLGRQDEAPAVPGDMVRVRCQGTLLDGTRCVGTDAKGLECRFRLGRGEVPHAWEEAVAALHPGARALVIEPPEPGRTLMPAEWPPATVVYSLELLGETAAGPAKGD